MARLLQQAASMCVAQSLNHFFQLVLERFFFQLYQGLTICPLSRVEAGICLSHEQPATLLFRS